MNGVTITLNDRTKSAVCRETVALCAQYLVEVNPPLSGGGFLVLHRRHVGSGSPDGRTVFIGGNKVADPVYNWDMNEVYAVVNLTTENGKTTGVLDLRYQNICKDFIQKYGTGANAPLVYAVYDTEGGGLAGEGEFDVKVVEPYYLSDEQDLALFKGARGSSVTRIDLVGVDSVGNYVYRMYFSDEKFFDITVPRGPQGASSSGACVFNNATRKYHLLTVATNSLGQLTVRVDPTEYDEPPGEVTSFVTVGDSQTIIGAKTFSSAIRAAGGVDGDLRGNVTGDVTGNLTGNVTGNVTGNLTGNVTGSLTGSVTIPDASNFNCQAPVHLYDLFAAYQSILLEGDVQCTGNETHTGSELHQGDETHTGSEEHFGAEVHHGAVTLENVVSPTAALTTEAANSLSVINAKYVWDLICMFAPYFDGTWRLIRGSGNVIDANWKTSGTQTGVFLPDETRVPQSFAASITTLLKFSAPNAVSVGASAFEGATGLAGINIPLVEEIGDLAFRTASANATLVDIVATELKRIGTRAFANRTGITAAMVNRMSKLEEIGFGAFQNCSAIAGDIRLPKLARMGELSFLGTGSIGVIDVGSEVPASELGGTSKITDAMLEEVYASDACGNNSYTTSQVPYSTTQAQWDANKPYFAEDKLREIYEASDDDNDFDEFTSFCFSKGDATACTSLIADNAQIVHDMALVAPSNLTDFHLANAVFIGNFAFSRIRYNNQDGDRHNYTLDSSLIAYYKKSLMLPKCRYIGNNAFGGVSYGCAHSVTVCAPELKYLGGGAFYLIRRMYGVYAPHVKKIGSYAFMECTDLVGSFYVEHAPTEEFVPVYIAVGQNGEIVPTGNGSLSALIFDECEFVGDGAFYNCSSIKNLYLRAATSIGTKVGSDTILTTHGVFAGCTALQNLYITAYPFTDDAMVKSRLAAWGTPGTVSVHLTLGGTGVTYQYINNAWTAV